MASVTISEIIDTHEQTEVHTGRYLVTADNPNGPDPFSNGSTLEPHFVSRSRNASLAEAAAVAAAALEWMADTTARAAELAHLTEDSDG